MSSLKRTIWNSLQRQPTMRHSRQQHTAFRIQHHSSKMRTCLSLPQPESNTPQCRMSEYLALQCACIKMWAAVTLAEQNWELIFMSFSLLSFESGALLNPTLQGITARAPGTLPLWWPWKHTIQPHPHRALLSSGGILGSMQISIWLFCPSCNNNQKTLDRFSLH